MDSDLRIRLQELLGPKELSIIENFLNRGFSLNGQVVIASIFGFAKEQKVPLERVLEECEKEWEKNWKFQHPELRGDPDAPGAAGRQNRTSLENIYKRIGIPNPFQEGKNIPKGPLKVRTSNSAYEFGPADENDERAVVRKGNPLPTDQCRIIFLYKGKSMTLVSVGRGSAREWTTSPVESITEG